MMFQRKGKASVMGLTAAGLLGLSGAAPAITVFADFDGDMAFDPVVTVAPNSSITLSIYGDVAATDALLSYGARAMLEPTFAQVPANGAAPDDSNWPLNPTLNVDNAAGTVDIFDGRIGSGLSGPAVHLFDITYELAAGSEVFSMQDVFPNNPNFVGFFTEDGRILDGAVTYQSTQINAVPLPAGALLFGSGLLGLLGAARARRKN